MPGAPLAEAGRLSLQLTLPEAQLGKLLGSLGQHHYQVQRDATGLLRIEGDAAGIQALLQLLPEYLSGDRQGIVLRDGDNVVMGRYIYEPESGHLVHTSTAPIGGGASAFALQRLDRLTLEKETFDGDAPESTATPDRAPAESLADPGSRSSDQPAERPSLLGAVTLLPEAQSPDADASVADLPVSALPVIETPVADTPIAEAPAVPPATESPLIHLAPTMSDMLNAVTFLENTVNATAQKLDTSLTLTDPDTFHFGGGVLSVAGSGLAEDALSFDTSGTVGIAGANVTVGGIVVGTLTATGAAGTSLTLQLNGNATTPRVETLLENLTYANSSDTPAASRTLTITLNDGDSGVTTHSIAVSVTGEVDDQLLTGTAASDTLTGGTGNDTITGLASADSLTGNGGADTIQAGAGDDIVSGGDGADTLVGDQGADTLDGGDGNDLLWGGMDDSAIASYDLTGLSTASNLKLWLDGNDLDGDGTAEGLSEAGLTGSAVGTWVDKSGVGNSATIGGGANQPTYSTGSVNGNSSLSFDGNDYLSIPDSASLSFTDNRFSIFIIAETNNSSINQGLLGKRISWEYSIYSRATPNELSFSAWTTAGSSVYGNRVSSDNPPEVYSWIADSSTAKTYDDSVQIQSANKSLTSNMGNGTSPLNIGSGGDGVGLFYWNGRISEIAIFNTNLTDPDRQALEYYLAEKWTLNVAGDNDSLSGGAGSDTIYGGSGNDTIDGGADADTITGGAGADSLVGGLAADLFRFTSTTDAGTGAAKDTISDFSQAQGDKIDLASLGVTLSIRGTAALGSPASFGQIRWAQSGSDTLIQIDTNGNTTADMEILLQNFTATNLTESDFTFASTAITYTAAGAESVFGGAGNDSLTGSTGADTIYGWTGNDTINANIGADSINGGAGNDSLNGLDQIDSLDGGAGQDTLTGGNHADYFIFSNLTHSTNAAPDLITDWSQAGGEKFILTGLGFTNVSDFENIAYNGSVTTIHDTNTNFAFTISGNVTSSLANADFIFGSAIIGTSSSELINGTNLSDLISAGSGNDTISGDGGDDSIDSGTGADSVYGGDGNDSLDGKDQIDTLDGGAGRDTLTGSFHADTFLFSDLTHSTSVAADRITDFANGSDLIKLTGLGFTALTDFETLSFSGGVTTLADTQTSFAITFTGDVTALLDNTDFIF